MPFPIQFDSVWLTLAAQTPKWLIAPLSKQQAHTLKLRRSSAHEAGMWKKGQDKRLFELLKSLTQILELWRLSPSFHNAKCDLLPDKWSLPCNDIRMNSWICFTSASGLFRTAFPMAPEKVPRRSNQLDDNVYLNCVWPFQILQGRYVWISNWLFWPQVLKWPFMGRILWLSVLIGRSNPSVMVVWTYFIWVKNMTRF